MRRHVCTRGTGGKDTRVLIVEDHWAWADAVASQLHQLPNVSVVGITPSSSDAFALVRTAKPDLALVVILLGEESGLQIARVLRARYPDLDIVIITSEATPWAVEEARRCGVRGLVAKDDLCTRESLHELILRAPSGTEFISRSVPAHDGEGERVGARAWVASTRERGGADGPGPPPTFSPAASSGWWGKESRPRARDLARWLLPARRLRTEQPRLARLLRTRSRPDPPTVMRVIVTLAASCELGREKLFFGPSGG
jgi:CheY-like chemotaxis protein